MRNIYLVTKSKLVDFSLLNEQNNFIAFNSYLIARKTVKNIFLINAHQPYPFSEGKLNQSLIQKAQDILGNKGYSLRKTAMTDSYTVEEELEKHQWADAIIIQSPVNWMGVPWSFKKYMDQVYTAGMKGELCNGDGRSRELSTLTLRYSLGFPIHWGLPKHP